MHVNCAAPFHCVDWRSGWARQHYHLIGWHAACILLLLVKPVMGLHVSLADAPVHMASAVLMGVSSGREPLLTAGLCTARLSCLCVPVGQVAWRKGGLAVFAGVVRSASSVQLGQEQSTQLGQQQQATYGSLCCMAHLHSCRTTWPHLILPVGHWASFVFGFKLPVIVAGP